MLDVRSVKPYLVMPNSSALLAAESDDVTSVLTQDNVAVDTNIDYENDSHVQFTVVKEPVRGAVDVVDDDGRTKPSCRRFSLADVRLGSVVYRRDASVDSGVEHDQFVVVVRLDDLQTTGSVDVDLRPRQPATTALPRGTLEVRGSLTATVDELADVVLTPDELAVAVTSLPVPVDVGDIRYEVTVEPRHGVLLRVGGAAVRTFTQADINAGRVLYRHRNVSSGADSFRFRVGHRDELFSDELEFIVDVVESFIPLNAGNLTVIEGQSTLVDASTLILGDRYSHSAVVVFTVVTQPSHGRLEAADRPRVRLTQFSGSQLQGSLVGPNSMSV